MSNVYINYIEPNYNYRHDDSSVEQAVPLEDLCIAIDLSVEIPPVQYNGQLQQDSIKYVVSWSSTEKATSINFYRGSENPNGEGYCLTTDYTKATFSDLVEGGTSELFGISSIDIQYRNYFTPQITIEFVDVRGASLFGLEEMRHPGVQGFVDEDVAGSFFRCFFIQPWPKFTLLVKGFYGPPVTYSLSCLNFKAKFDSKTGNFKATVNFIGHEYGFLGDVMLSPLLASPNSPFYGKEYWDAQCNNGRFTVDGVPMPKVTKILTDYANLTATLGQVMAETSEKQALEGTDSNLSKLDELEGAYNNVYTSYKKIIDKLPDYAKKNVYNNSKNGNTFVALVPKSYKNLIEDLFDDEIEKVQEEYNIFASGCTDAGIPMENTPFFDFEIKSKYKKDAEPTVSDKYNHKQEVNDFIKKKQTEASNAANIPKDATEAKFYKESWINNDELVGVETNESSFKEYIQSKKTELGGTKEEQKAAVAAKENEVISTSLGFRPTVYNITKIMMAHMETYVYEITECHNKIHSTSRTTQDILQAGDASFCVPFPQVLKQVTNKDTNIESLEAAWIGEVSNNHPEAYEKDLIEGLIKGLDELKKAIEYNNAVQSLAANGELGGGSGGAERPFLPSDVIDGQIWSSIDDTNLQSVSNAILLRAMGVFCAFGEDNNYDSDAKKIGEADGKAFVKLFPTLKASLGSVIENLKADTIISSGVSSNIITEANNKVQLKGTLLPITHIDTRSNTMVDSNGIVQQTQYPQYYLKWGENSEKHKTFDVFTSENAERFITNNSISDGVGVDKKVALKIGGEYKDWYNEEGDSYGTFICEEFKANGDNTPDYKPIEENGLFADTQAAMKTTPDNVFKVDDEDDWGKWASEGWGFDRLKTSKGVIERGGSFKDCLDGYEKFKEKIGTYTVTLFNGLNWGDSQHQTLQSAHGVSIFSQRRYAWATNLHYKAYLFLESCISSRDKVNGLTYGETLSSRIKDGWVKSCPYLFILYIGALQSADSECQNFKEVKNKKNKLFKDINSAFANICYKEFKEWVGAYFAKTIMANYELKKDSNSIKIITDYLATKNNSGLCAKFAAWFGDNFFKNYISFKNANASSYEQKNNDFSVSINANDELYGFRLFVRQNSTSKDIAKHLFQPCVIVQYGSNHKIESSGATETAPKAIDKSTLTTYIDAFISGMSISAKTETTATETQNTTTNSNATQTTTDATKKEGEGNSTTKSVPKYGNKIPKAAEGSSSGATTSSGTTTSSGETSGSTSATSTTDSAITESSSTVTANVENFETANEVKASLYQYTKALYDKWMKGNIGHGQDIGEFVKLENFFDKHFHFIDTFYNYTTDVYIDLHHFCGVLFQSNNQGSYQFFNFLSSIYAKGFGFYMTQNFMDYNDPELMQAMFQPIPYIEMKRPSVTDTHIDFIVLKQNEVSHQLHMVDENGNDMDDSFMLGDDVDDVLLPIPISSKSAAQRPQYMSQDPTFLNKFNTPNHIYKIPCFGVAYGKQYENYFTDIDVQTDNHVATNESINAELRIITDAKPQFAPEQQENASNMKIQCLSQDLFSVFMNNSYTCSVTMMGCAWVQPLMYFCLTNVPMFRGAYQIIAVKHSIRPGNMTTTFTGVRMARTSLPHIDKMLVRSIDNTNGAGDGSGAGFDQTTLANIDNDCGYKYFNPFSPTGGSVAELADINKLKNTRIIDVCPERVAPLKTKSGEVLASSWDILKNESLFDFFTGLIFCEAGTGKCDDVDRQLIAITLINRVVDKGSIQGFLKRNLIRKQYAYVGSSIDNNKPYREVVLNRSDADRKQWGVCEKAVEITFANPYCVVGATATPNMPLTDAHGAKSATKAITENDVKYMVGFVNDKFPGDVERLESKYYYYLVHKGVHFFHGNTQCDKNINKYWANNSSASTSSSDGKEKELTPKEKLEKIIGAIGQTVSHSTTIGFSQIHHKISGDGAYVSTKADHTEDVGNATLFDIIYNTYYNDLGTIYWLTKDANSVGGECRGVYIALGESKKIGVAYMDNGNLSTKLDALTEKDSKVSGIFNEKFYKALGKKFKSVDNNNKKQFLEIRNYKDTDVTNFNKLITNYAPQPCPTPSTGVEGGGSVDFSSPITPPANLNMSYSGDFPYAGSPFKLGPFTSSRHEKACGGNEPNATEKRKLGELVKTLLHPLYDTHPFAVNSSFRNHCVNTKVGSKDTSQHRTGEAADIDSKDGSRSGCLILFDKAYQLLVEHKYNNFGQLLYEVERFNKANGCPSTPEWVHLSIPCPKWTNDVRGMSNKGGSYTIPHKKYKSNGNSKCPAN